MIWKVQFVCTPSNILWLHDGDLGTRRQRLLLRHTSRFWDAPTRWSPAARSPRTLYPRCTDIHRHGQMVAGE